MSNQIMQRMLFSIQLEDRQSCTACRFPIALGVVADMQNLAWRKTDNPYRPSKNLGVWFIRTELTGNENVLEKFGNIEVLEDETQAAVKI